MILIREAAECDNNALNELQRKCPMGTSLVLGVDSSPDYFARSRPFKDWHVFVAAENNTIVGSAAFAISDTYVEDRKIKTAYEYGFVVDPLHRRKGIAVLSSLSVRRRGAKPQRSEQGVCQSVCSGPNLR